MSQLLATAVTSKSIKRISKTDPNFSRQSGCMFTGETVAFLDNDDSFHPFRHCQGVARSFGLDAVKKTLQVEENDPRYLQLTRPD
ncbi:hypothetical protein H9P43_007752 [Blastocladiella emersonii ATCC 22665]|nr:hypothetical protein H9P43_007752 [Blastocladiella emersonii ATCC 22665]